MLNAAPKKGTGEEPSKASVTGMVKIPSSAPLGYSALGSIITMELPFATKPVVSSYPVRKNSAV